MDEKNIIITLVFLYSSAIVVSDASLKCTNGLTTLTQDFSTNVRTKQLSQYEIVNSTHLRVCQCEIKPCLKLCCGKGRLVVNNTCQEPPVKITDTYTKTLPGLDISNFFLIYGNGCPMNYFTRFYPNDYINVKYYLQSNGSLSVFFDDDLRQLNDFCLEQIFSSTQNSSRLLICIPKNFSPSIYDFPIVTVKVFLQLGMVISIPFLVATLMVYSFRELRNIHGKNLMCHVASLLTAYLSVFFVEIMKLSLPESLCITFGFVRQFSFLSSFFWLNVMCFDIWWSLSAWSGFQVYSKENERKRFIKYSACGWGCPAIIVAVTAVMQFSPIPDGMIRPGINFPHCFLTDGWPFYAYFYGPVIFLFCTDVTLFILSAILFITAKRKTMNSSIQQKLYIQGVRSRYFLLLKIFIMMGFNWIIDPFSWIFESSLWTWIFIHFSITLQAVGIFIFFVWKTEVKNIIISKLCISRVSDIATVSLLGTPETQVLNSDSTSTTTSC